MNTTIKNLRNDKLQELCRKYLCKIRYMAKKHGLRAWLEDIIEANRRKECEATEKEVYMLARLCDEERVVRTDIPTMLGKSYRECIEHNDFDKIKKLRHVGIYSNVDAMLYSVEDAHRRKVKELKDKKRRYMHKK